MSINPKPSITQYFTSFLRLGIIAFGGPSMIAYIRKMTVEKEHWLDAEIFRDGVALCQMIPGATAMQTAAYVGLKTQGVIGAGASFIGLGLPAFLLMLTFAALYTNNHNLPIVISAFSGLQAIIVAILANAALSFGKNTLKDWKAFGIAAIAAGLFSFRVNPIFVIILAVVMGLVFIKPTQTNTTHPALVARNPTYLKPLLLLLSVSTIVFLLLFIFNRTFFNLAILMFRIDLFAFGGGFASVPLMFHEIVEVRNWMDSQTFMNGIVLGQVTPGPIRNYCYLYRFYIRWLVWGSNRNARYFPSFLYAGGGCLTLF